MEPVDQIKRGIEKACARKKISVTAACVKAGIQPSTLSRFRNGGDIKLETLSIFFRHGLGVKWETILRLGREK